ncbi:uncharacterized protein LOC117517918 [Thalassophryne amazonica]|uniref:uncharacterized protein LOC117517918 n=1 Tax=Thalassophryne amazonica TaxID=390379 RepID=UPI0014717B06|nr:uncharacterized protein LOC117517918 [Thalassophryne amazonica]
MKESLLMLMASQLSTWINSQRSRYGKHTATKSGQGAPTRLTECDQWIKKSWAFLEDYIVRVPSWESGSRLARTKISVATTKDHNSVVSTSYFASALPPVDSSDEEQSHSSSSQASYEGKKWKHKTTSSGEDLQQALFEWLMEQASQTQEESKALTAPKTANKCAVDAFVSYLSTQLVQIREEDWLPFTVDTIQLVNSYITRARAVV